MGGPVEAAAVPFLIRKYGKESMTVKKITCLTTAMLALSACSGQSTEMVKPSVMEVNGLRIYNADSEHQTSFIKDHGSSERVCFSRGEDAVETQSSGISGDLGFLNTSEDMSETSSRGAVVLGGRNPAVLISREVFYRICELTINLNLSKDEAIKLFREGMDITTKLSISDTPKPSASASTDDDTTKKDAEEASPQGVD
jgi:hypothetical protein